MTTEQTDQLKQDEMERITLLDIAIVLGEEKRTVVAVTLVTSILSVIYAMGVTPTFTAKTIIMPPQQQQSAATSILANLGALAGVAGVSTGIKSSDELYISLFKTEAMQNDLVAKLNLKEHYKVQSLPDARRALGGAVRVISDKRSGLMTIEVDDADPVFAAKLANAQVPALRQLLGNLAVTESQQRRLFLEQRVSKTKEVLVAAELRFRQALEKTGMSVTQTIAEFGAKSSIDLRTRIAQREVQLQAMRSFAGPQNPDMLVLAAELSALRGQLAKLEHGSGDTALHNSAGQEAVVAYRDIKVQEAVLEALVKQYEMAHIDESQEGPLVQQIDVASVPEKRSKPIRTRIVQIAVILGFFLGVLIALVRRAWRGANTDPSFASRFSEIRRAWHWSKFH